MCVSELSIDWHCGVMYVAPSEQAPPIHVSVNSSAISLSWTSPDRPNGLIELYQLFRNSTLIATQWPNGMTSSYVA